MKIDRKNLKNREFIKKAPQNCDSEQVTIGQGQDASENRHSEAKQTLPKPDFLGYFGIHAFITTLLLTCVLYSEESTPLLDHATVSIYAVDTKSGQVLIETRADLSLQPSSCLKIITTAAALHLLGENNRFETQLEYDGTLSAEGTLKGNLYLRGGGDPCLGSSRIAGNLGWTEQLDSWVSAVKQAGIHIIEGSVIADTTRWEKGRTIPSWEWEDLGNYYGAAPSALSFHENCYALTFQPGKKKGDAVQIVRTDPPIHSLLFENEVTTGAEGSGDQACIYGSELSALQLIRGTIPCAVKEFTIKGAIPDPATLTTELLTQRLEEQRVLVQKKSLEQKGQRTPIQTCTSPTIPEIVYQANQKSINLYAEHLLKKMGEVVYNEGSTQAGLKAVSGFLKDKGIDLGGFHMVDGSGLSRKNLLTTKQLVTLLIQMKQSSLFPLFFASLPAVEKGIHAKSGSMSLIKGYAGYADEIAFAVLINNCPDRAAANRKIEEVFARLRELNAIERKS